MTAAQLSDVSGPLGSSGGLTGGYVGGRLARVVPEAIVRWIVIAVGATVTVISIRRYWWPA